ncbi:hypothetical protein AVEN_206851-1 [Araneus ventricosus]|uniref:Uncharacterized protein n=1 Tax=Araneus ventricosus TaxID=182803 RepID=A0A4Y2F962_ARAVE|nr:hypothetical protein AVEN_206851-1 [Araneus ventricosus]
MLQNVECFVAHLRDKIFCYPNDKEAKFKIDGFAHHGIQQRRVETVSGHFQPLCIPWGSRDPYSHSRIQGTVATLNANPKKNDPFARSLAD